MAITEQINEILREYSIGNKLQAYKKLKKIFFKFKTNNKIRYNLAVMEKELGFLDLAKKNFQFLIDNENHIKSMINYYLIEIKNEKYLNALRIINLVIKKDNSQINVIRDKAYVMYKIKNFDESKKVCLSLLQKNNQDELTFNILGLTYLNTNKFIEAEDALLKGLKINPRSAPLLNSLGRLYHESKQTKKSEEIFIKALEIDPTAYATLNNIAGFYLEEGLYEKAITYYKKAKKNFPNNSIILMNIAKAYFNLNNLKFAENYCLKALKINNSNDDINKTYSLILLKNQKYSKAWKFFDGRLNLSEFSKKNLSLIKVKDKLLRNNKLSKDSKILVLREQGVGDEILYGTMYEDLIHNYENVTIECDERLISIFQNSFDVKHKSKFVKLGSILNDDEKLITYDHVVYAGSLGKYFRNSIKNFNNNAYLKLDKNITNKTKKKISNLNKKYNIGISWRSFKNRYANEKSLKLEDMLDLFGTSSCNFINLQYGKVNNEISDFCLKHKLIINTIDNLDLYNDLIGVASLLKNLDLFVTVSNSTAHLAGGLGVKTLLIKPLNHASYHYWNQPTSKTPWYKSVELIDKKNFLTEKNLINKYLL